MTKNSDNADESNHYKDVEFKAFLETIKEGQVAHWVEIATALSVDQDTITRWKQTPEAQEAIREGISHALACMQQAGARDWRMWETKLKLLGINSTNLVDVTSGGKPIKTTLVEFVGADVTGQNHNSNTS